MTQHEFITRQLKSLLLVIIASGLAILISITFYTGQTAQQTNNLIQQYETRSNHNHDNN